MLPLAAPPFPAAVAAAMAVDPCSAAPAEELAPLGGAAGSARRRGWRRTGGCDRESDGWPTCCSPPACGGLAARQRCARSSSRPSRSRLPSLPAAGSGSRCPSRPRSGPIRSRASSPTSWAIPTRPPEWPCWSSTSSSRPCLPPDTTTALSFGFDAPGARPPQTILLAVPPVPGVAWTIDALAGRGRRDARPGQDPHGRSLHGRVGRPLPPCDLPHRRRRRERARPADEGARQARERAGRTWWSTHDRDDDLAPAGAARPRARPRRRAAGPPSTTRSGCWGGSGRSASCSARTQPLRRRCVSRRSSTRSAAGVRPAGEPADFDPQTMPLEALVEREPPVAPTLRQRLDAWTRLVDLLHAAGPRRPRLGAGRGASAAAAASRDGSRRGAAAAARGPGCRRRARRRGVARRRSGRTSRRPRPDLRRLGARADGGRSGG